MPEEQKAWRCTLCGYVHRGATPPEYCPICGASGSEFEAYEEPSTQSASQTSSTQWRCLTCGYIHDGDMPPEYCPICGADPKQFEPVREVEHSDDPASKSIKAIIVGGGIAGVSAAEAIRDASPESSITIISSEPVPPYYRLNLTRYLADEIQPTELFIHPETWYNDKKIDLLTGHGIAEISREDHTVTLDNSKTLPYDKLILAMGSHPFIPPIPGADLSGVFSVRTSEDADRIIEKLANGAACVCIGGGILGLETAGALAKRGGNITLLESHDWLMPRQLTKEAAEILEAHIESIGVKLIKNARTSEFVETSGQVKEVLLESGERIACDIVIICTGVRSNTHLARKCDLEVNQGIIVDNHLKTSDPDILAAGDVAEHNGIVYGAWSPSQFQGKIAGMNALGKETPFGGMPRSNALKVLGLDMLSIGQFVAEDGSYQVIQKKDGTVFYHFVFHDSKMVGCILLGDTEPSANVKKAIETKKNFSKILSSHPTCETLLKEIIQ